MSFSPYPSPFLALAAGCYSPCLLHRQARFWNTCTTTGCKLFRQREFPDSIDTVAAPFVQALAQSIARTSLPFSPQLLRLCTDCRHPFRPLARQPAGRVAAAALPAFVHRWRRPGARTFSLPPLPLRGRLKNAEHASEALGRREGERQGRQPSAQRLRPNQAFTTHGVEP